MFAAAEDVPNGARIVVLATSAEAVPQVRRHLHEGATRMSERHGEGDEGEQAPAAAPAEAPASE